MHGEQWKGIMVEVWDEKGAGKRSDCLQPAIGLRVYRVWLSPSRKIIFIRLEGNRVIYVEVMDEIVEPGFQALKISTGTADRDKDWSEIDAAMVSQEPHLVDLRGRRFVGMDAEVLMFSGGVGAMMTPQGVRWVKEKRPTTVH